MGAAVAPEGATGGYSGGVLDDALGGVEGSSGSGGAEVEPPRRPVRAACSALMKAPATAPPSPAAALPCSKLRLGSYEIIPDAI